MFFRRKKSDQVEGVVEATPVDANEADQNLVEGTAPQIEEAAEVSLSAEDKEQPVALASSSAVAADGEAIRLFPGFERDDFEVGFRADAGQSALMMRWKDGGEWFQVPALFNRGVLAAMDERDSASDLNRLLRNYGYDVDAVAK